MPSGGPRCLLLGKLPSRDHHRRPIDLLTAPEVITPKLDGVAYGDSTASQYFNGTRQAV